MALSCCPVCGKKKAIFWPEFWVYRRGETFYCSEDCMRVDETKDMKLIKMIARVRARSRKGVQNNMNGKITAEQKTKAIEMAIRGESPLAYLKQIGMKNPSSTWQYIKSTLKKTNPKKYAEIPEKLPNQKTETPEGTTTTVTVTGPIVVETPEAGTIGVVNIPEDIAPSVTEKKEPPAPKRVNGFGLVEIRGTFGTYSWKSGYFAFDPVQYGVPLEYELGEWKVFLKELHNAAELLGVEL